MSTEEPAWKAEVMKTVGTAERGSVVDLLTLLEPHILAAEQRGRETRLPQLMKLTATIRTEVLHEAAERLRERAETIAGYDDAYRHAADFIDPDKT